MMARLRAILATPMARTIVTAAGRPSGMTVSEVLQKHLDAPLLAEFFPGQPILAYFEFAPGVSDQSSRVVDDALKLSQAGVRIDPEELSEKTGYQLERSASAKATADGAARRKTGYRLAGGS